MARLINTVYLIFLVWSTTATTSETVTPTSTGNETVSDTGEIDFDTLMNLYGVTPELAQKLRQNLLKAIAAEKESEAEKVRQGEFGGVSGGFFQGGGNGGGGGGGGGGGNRPGGGGGGDEDYDEDGADAATTQGPGFFGVLSGLFGVASGVGSGNPTRVLQSMVNFFPPSQRGQVQMFVDQLIGFIPQDNRTVRPRPRPSATGVTPSPILGMMMTGAGAGNAGNVPGTIVAKGGEGENGTTTNSTTADETDIFDLLTALLPVIAQLEGFEDENDTETTSIKMSQSLVNEIVEAETETEVETVDLNVSSPDVKLKVN